MGVTMIKKTTALILLFLGLLTLSTFTQAKDMKNRLGVGPKAPFSIPLEAIAVHYSPNRDYVVTGSIGINTQQGSSMFGIQGGIRRILFEEQLMNFFIGGSLGIISQEVNSSNRSGFELDATAGGEFFFQGLENLGFNFEVGVGVSSLRNANKFYTLGRTPMSAGIIFYF